MSALLTHSRTTLARAVVVSLLAMATIHGHDRYFWKGGTGDFMNWWNGENNAPSNEAPGLTFYNSSGARNAIAQGASDVVNLNNDYTANYTFHTLVIRGGATMNINGNLDIATAPTNMDLSSGGTYNHNAYIVQANALTGGSGTYNLNSGGSLVLTNGLSASDVNYNFNFGTGGNGENVSLTASSVSIDNANNNVFTVGSGSSLTLTGSGSNFADGFAVNGGTLQLGNGGAGGSIDTSYALDLANGGKLLVNRTDTVTQGTDFSSAAITGSGYIANDGDGTLILDRANSHTGGARLGRDNLQDESATRLLKVTHNDALGTGTLGFYKSGTFELGADSLTIANDVFSGNYSGEGNAKIIKLDLTGANSGTMSGNIDTRGGIFEGFQMDVGADDTLTLSGNIYNGAGGGSGITKIGDGTLILSGTNTYNGDTRVNAGTLKLSGGSAIKDIRNVFVDASGTLDLNGSSETINRLTGSGTINNSTGNGILIVGSNNSSFQFDGSLTDSVGALQLRMNGTGEVTLTGASDHNGQTEIYNGTIVASHSSALGTGQVYMGVTSGVTQTLAIGADGVNIANNFFLQNSNSTHVIKMDVAGTNAATISGNMTNQVDYAGKWDFVVGADDTLTVSGNLTSGSAGNSGIDKDGAGTLVLSGANTYKGATRVNEGTLSLATGYTHSGTGAYTVEGATFKIADGVNISTHAMTINSGGVVSPGNSPGTATTGSQTWNDGGTYLWEVNDSGGTKGADPGWDWLDITGTLELGSLTAGGFTIDIDSLTASNVIGDAVGFDTFTQMDGIVDYSFVIATASGGINNFDASLFTLDLSDFSNAPSWYWEIVLSGNDLVLEAYAVPEPSSMLLLGLGGLALALRRKRS
ncbi:MAG: beta strand repeat-containing protein [Luteolibacter sp.]